MSNNILIIDEKISMRQILKYILRKVGYKNFLELSDLKDTKELQDKISKSRLVICRLKKSTSYLNLDQLTIPILYISQKKTNQFKNMLSIPYSSSILINKIQELLK